MNDSLRNVLLILFFLGAAHHVVHAQQVVQDLTWYESFFKESNQRSFEEIVNETNEWILEADETRDGAAKSQALKQLGLLYLTRANDYDRALTYLIAALSLEDSLQLKPTQVYTYLAMAQVFEAVGDPTKSIQFLKQAFDINEQYRDVRTLITILIKLGNVHATQGRLDEAYENFDLALEYRNQNTDRRTEAELLFNVANLYQLQGKHATALQTHKEALTIWRSIKDKRSEAKSLSDIGELYRVMKNDERTLANHVAALEIRKQLKDKRGLAESYNHVSLFYFHQRNLPRAIANARLAVQAASEAQHQLELRKGYDLLSLSYTELKDFKQALEFKNLYVAISELIQHETNERQLLETQNRYVVEKKESEIEKLESIRIQRELELEAQKRFQNFLFILIGLGVVIAALIFYLYILKRQSNNQLQAINQKVQEQNVALQELNATKDKFFSIISHDLKGPLNSLTSFSGLLINHTESLSKEEIQLLAKDLDKSVKNLFTLLENLLEWSRSQTGAIEFTPEQVNLTEVLQINKELLSAQASTKKINILFEPDEIRMVQVHKNSIHTVVRNLLSNAIKFTPEKGTIALTLTNQPTSILVAIADTGVGMEPEVLKKLFRIDTKHSTKGTANEKGTGLGLILCKEFVEKNGGTLWVESEVGKGSTFYFTLPR